MHCLCSPVHCLHSDLPGDGVSVCVRVCVLCVGCVSMSLLWSEMTLRSRAILPTVNIIQYHPTGINMVVLLLAEMCCCSGFSARRHFLAPTRFLLGMCRMMADDTDLPQERLGRGLSFGSVVSSASFCTRVCLLDYSVYLCLSLTVIPLLQCLFNKRIK